MPPCQLVRDSLCGSTLHPRGQKLDRPMLDLRQRFFTYIRQHECQIKYVIGRF